VLQSAAECCSVLQRGAVYCSVLQDLQSTIVDHFVHVQIEHLSY